MNTDYLTIFIIFTEEWTSTNPWLCLHLVNEVILVHVGLSVIFDHFFGWHL